MMTLMGVGVCASRQDEYRWPVPPSLPIQLEFNHVSWSVRKRVASPANRSPLKAPPKTIVVSRFFKNILHICRRRYYKRFLILCPFHSHSNLNKSTSGINRGYVICA